MIFVFFDFGSETMWKLIPRKNKCVILKTTWDHDTAVNNEAKNRLKIASYNNKTNCCIEDVDEMV